MKFTSFSANLNLAFVFMFVETMFQMSSLRGMIFQFEALQGRCIVSFFYGEIYKRLLIFFAKRRCYDENHITRRNRYNDERSTFTARCQILFRCFLFFVSLAVKLIKSYDFVAPFRSCSIYKYALIKFLLLRFSGRAVVTFRWIWTVIVTV